MDVKVQYDKNRKVYFAFLEKRPSVFIETEDKSKIKYLLEDAYINELDKEKNSFTREDFNLKEK